MKTIEAIDDCFPKALALKTIRKKRRLKQEEVTVLSGGNVRYIIAYGQGKNDIAKAQGDTFQMLAKTLSCSIEYLLK